MGPTTLRTLGDKSSNVITTIYVKEKNVYIVAFTMKLALGIRKDMPTLPALALKRMRERENSWSFPSSVWGGGAAVGRGGVHNKHTHIPYPLLWKGCTHVLFFSRRTPAPPTGTFKSVIKNRQLHLWITQHTTSTSLPHTAAATAQLIKMQSCTRPPPLTLPPTHPPTQKKKVCAPFLTHKGRGEARRDKTQAREADDR